MSDAGHAANAFVEHIRNQVVGHPVSYRRLALNSLLIYVDCQPGDPTGVIFWFEPTWHLRGPDRVLTGSRQAQPDEDAKEPDAGFRAAGLALDALWDRTVEAVEVEPVTHSLIVRFEGGYEVRTFVSDPTSDLDWHIDENATGHSVEGHSGGVKLVRRGDREANTDAPA
ncbi:MAG TPA: hypothetical protein VK689_14890 [Armatimonadota bacterium]|nr:hypothetical protein [Armatimonadota bacterium]